MNEIKEAERLVKKFYSIESNFQWCEAKRQALLCVEEILKLLYNEFYDIKNGTHYEFYIKVKKQIEKI